MSDSSNNSGGIGFLAALTLLFIGLKIGGVIDWSWWLVLLPLYGPIILVLFVLGIVLLVVGVAAYLEDRWR